MAQMFEEPVEGYLGNSILDFHLLHQAAQHERPSGKKPGRTRWAQR